MASTKALSAKDMNGLKIVSVGDPTAAQDASTKTYTDTQRDFAKSRANHTGTQTASTVSDFDSQVRTSRLDQMAAPTGSVSMGSQKITNQADPTVASDSATKAYVDLQVSGLVSGQTLKGAVRVVQTANVTVSNPGTAVFDGVTLANGDVVLLAGQSTGSQNGPYVFNGSGSALTRATNWDADAEAVLGSYWIVREGTKADSFALLSNDTAITIGTTTAAFAYISVAGAAIGRYAVNCGAISAGADWTITHNLGSTDVIVQFKRVASPYDYVEIYAKTTDANTIVATPDIALSNAEFRAICKY